MDGERTRKRERGRKGEGKRWRVSEVKGKIRKIKEKKK